MDIDVIIPTCRPGRKLTELLRRLSLQTLPVRNIILMDTRSDTDTASLTAGYPNVRTVTVEKEEFDHGGTRNAGAGLSDAGYLLFMTQDALPRDKYLVERLYAAFEDPGVKAAYARQYPEKDCSELEKFTRSFNYPDKSRVKTEKDLQELGIKTFFCSNACAMYEHAAFTELGGFPDRTIFNEDMIYAGGLIRSGSAIAYVAEAGVIHSHNYTGVEQFHRNFDLAVSQADHPEIFSGVSSEDEGVRLVAETALHCIKIHRARLLIPLVYISACKFLGYRLGKNYRKLPKKLILSCTMNPGYWR